MTCREIVMEQIDHRETPRVPYTLSISKDVEARLDTHYRGETWRDRITKYIKSYDVTGDAAWQELDEKHARDAFGTVWRTDKIPVVVETVPLKEPSFENYEFPSAEFFVDPALVKEVKRKIDEQPDLFTTVSIPCLWASWYFRGFETTMMDIIAEEDFYVDLLDRLTELTLGIIELCADLPVDAIMVGDDWGEQRGVMIGPDRWRKFYKPRYAKIFEAICDKGKTSILHCCGSVFDIMDDIVEIGLNVLESVQPEAANMNPFELKRRWGENITFWGGLGTQYTIPFAKPAEIRHEIRKLRADMAKRGGYILAPAKPLRPEVPTENAVAVFEEFVSEGN